MGTPQGPNGSDKDSNDPKSEDRNGKDVRSPQEGGAEPAGKASSGGGEPTSSDKPAEKPAGEPDSAPEPEKREDAPKTRPIAGDQKGTAAAAEESGAGSARPQAPQKAPAAGQTPPWQRGQQTPQNTPQTNLPGVGPGLSKGGARPAGPARPATGAQPAVGKAGAPNPGPGSAAQGGPGSGNSGAGQGKPAAGPQGGAVAPPTRPVVTGTAAARATGGAQGTGGSQGADRASATKVKAAAIDGPTRHIERKDLAKDLPDLSTVKHPTGSEAASAAAATVVTERPHAGPVVVPAAASDEPLRATVQVRRIDPWSMLKVSSVISLSLFFVWMIAVGLLYGVLAGMGVWDRLNSAFTEIVSDSGGGGLISAGQVFGYATVIGLANTVLLTALATLGAFIYNLCTDLVGGVQVTLADPD